VSLSETPENASTDRQTADIADPAVPYARIPIPALHASRGWPPFRRLVYEHLIALCDNRPRYQVNARTIAEAIGLSLRRTQLHIAALEADGWIERVPPWSKHLHRGTPWRIAHLQSKRALREAQHGRAARRKPRQTRRERREEPGSESVEAREAAIAKSIAEWRPERASLQEYRGGALRSLDVTSGDAIASAAQRSGGPLRHMTRGGVLTAATKALTVIVVPTRADAMIIARRLTRLAQDPRTTAAAWNAATDVDAWRAELAASSAASA